MGDPRKARKKYTNPKKPWDKSRLDAEKIIVKEYGTANKTELYRMQYILRKFGFQAKSLMSSTSAQAENERKALISKLQALSLLNKDAQLDDVLALELKNIMERRLQTIVLRKGLANTIKQARQMIVHKHVRVAGKIITAPSYIVSKDEEAKIVFNDKSSFANPDHPERPEQIVKLKASYKTAKKGPITAEVPAESPAPEAAKEVTQ